MGLLGLLADKVVVNAKAFWSATTGATAEIESELKALGLGQAQLADQTEGELFESLEKINQLLDNPEDQPAVYISVVDGEYTVRDKDDPELDPAEGSTIRYDAGAKLLNRRDFVIKRLQTLNTEAREDLAKAKGNDQVSDKEKTALDAELQKLRADQHRLDQLKEDTDNLREEQDFRREMEIANFQLIQQEKRAELSRLEMATKADLKSRWWQTRLGRDSIAALVGGLLLVGFAGAVVVAMFLDVQTSDIVQNAFLLILGYFFGAATSSRPTSEGGV